MIRNMQYLSKALQKPSPWLWKSQIQVQNSFSLLKSIQQRSFSSHTLKHINIDFYKSRNFGYSFLEMPNNSQSVDFVSKALKELELYYDSDGKIVKEINEAYLDIQEYLNNNQEDIRKALSFNNKYAHFMDNVKKDPVLAQKASTYSNTIRLLENLLKEDVMAKNISYNILSPVSSLLLNLGIVDLSLWKKVIEYTFLYPEKFTSNKDLRSTLMCISSFLKRFNFSENSETGFARYHFFFKESELSSIITRHIISSFFTKFDRFFLDKVGAVKTNINDICVIISVTCEIIEKLARISFVNHHEERKFLKKFEGILVENLKYITPHHCLDIFQSYLSMGFYNKAFLQRFIDYFTQHNSVIDPNKVLLPIIRAWKAEGKYDEEIYTNFVRNNLKNFIQDPKRLMKLPGLAFDLIIIHLKDEEIWSILLDRIAQIPMKDLRYFQKKSLHLLFQNLKTQNYMTVDLSPHSDIMNYLSKFCIGNNLKYDFTELHIPEIEDKGLVNCCDKHTIEKYRLTFKEKVLAHPEQYKHSLVVNEQIQNPTFHETMIRNAVEGYFAKFLKTPIRVTHELPVCSYKVDIALEVPDIYDKIAIEISGLVYTFESGAFIGKKNLKFEFLKKNGWILIQVNLGTNISHNLMSIACDANLEKIAKIVYDLLRTEVKKQLGKDLPVLETSKWMRPKESVSNTEAESSIEENNSNNGTQNPIKSPSKQSKVKTVKSVGNLPL